MTESSGADVYRLSGELIFATVPRIWQASEKAILASEGGLDIDLGDVTRADSAGLALLIGWLRLAEQHNKLIKFKNIPESLLNIARVSGVDQFLLDS